MVYEFRLKYAKSQQSGHFGHCGIGTALIGIDTDLVLMGGTGTACIDTGTDWLLFGGTGTALFRYRYHFGNLPRIAFFPSFGTISLHTTSIFHNTSRINMEFIQNHSITLVLVVWNLIPQNPRRKSYEFNLRSTIPTKPYNYDDSMFILHQLGFFPTKLKNSRVNVISPQNPRVRSN